MDWFYWFQAAVLGIVEGLTEFLPVSSTGHLIIAADAVGFAQTPGSDTFVIAIQAGAILAVCWYYRARILSVLKGLFSEPKEQRLAVNTIVAFLPAAVIGVLVAGLIKAYLFNAVTVAVALVVGGLLILWIENRQERLGIVPRVATMDDMTWKDRYIYFFRSLASVSFRKPKAFYNMFYGPHSEELGRIMRVYFNQLYPEELNGIDAGFAQVMREGILVNKYRLLFTNLLREENYTEEVEEITPVLLNSLYHTFLHEAIKRGKDFDVEQKAAYFVNLVKTILDGSVIISNYQKEHD